MISHPRNRILLTLPKVETIKLNKFFEDVMIYTRQDANLDTTTDCQCINGQSAATSIRTKSATSRHQVRDPFFSLATTFLWLPFLSSCTLFLLLNATFYAQPSPPYSSFLVTTKSSASLSPPSTTIHTPERSQSPYTLLRSPGDALDGRVVLVD